MEARAHRPHPRRGTRSGPAADAVRADPMALGVRAAAASDPPVLAHTAIVAAALLVVEVNHRFELGPWLYVTPDFQYVFRPGGSDEEPDATVFGAEIGVDF